MNNTDLNPGGARTELPTKPRSLAVPLLGVGLAIGFIFGLVVEQWILGVIIGLAAGAVSAHGVDGTDTRAGENGEKIELRRNYGSLLPLVGLLLLTLLLWGLGSAGG